MSMTTSRVYRDFDEVARDVVHNTPNVPLKAIAIGMGLKERRLYEATNADPRQKRIFHPEWIVPVTRITQNFAIVRYFCQEVGGYFVKLPERQHGSLGIVTAALGAVMREVGDVVKLAGDALDDNELDVVEQERWLLEIEQAERALAGLKQLVKEVPAKSVQSTVGVR